MALTNTLLNQIRDDTQDALDVVLSYGGVGEGSTAATANDTALVSEVFRDIIDTTDVASANDEITVGLIISTTQANGNTIQEAALFEDASDTVDNCDAITGWTDSADMTVSLNTTTFYEGTGSINLTKDGTATVNASTSKQTTSVDFTSKTLSLQLYIDDQTTLDDFATSNCLTIRFGSDETGATDYYQWAFDKADLAVGKNFIDTLTSANADSTSGTPSLLLMDYCFIQITSAAAGDTWAAGKVLMDDIKLISGDMWARSILTSITKTDDVELYLDWTVTITVTES